MLIITKSKIGLLMISTYFEYLPPLIFGTKLFNAFIVNYYGQKYFKIILTHFLNCQEMNTIAAYCLHGICQVSNFEIVYVYFAGLCLVILNVVKFIEGVGFCMRKHKTFKSLVSGCHSHKMYLDANQVDIL